MKNKSSIWSLCIGLMVLVVLSMSFYVHKTTKAKSLVDHYGQLSVKGTNIVDQYGKPLQLRGMSLYWSQWQPEYYNPTTIKWLRDDWKITVIRAAMAVESGGYAAYHHREKEKIDKVIKTAIRLGIYVIVDYHSHEAHKDIERAKEFFHYISKKYGKHPNIIYETYNEPLDDSWSEVLKPYHEELIKVIRKNDPDNIIVCGSRTWSQRVDEVSFDPIEAPNIAYSFHFYAGTHTEELREKAQLAIDNGICLFATEFGVCDASGRGGFSPKESKVWWDFLDEHQISWCNWSVANKPETASILKPEVLKLGGWKEKHLTPSGILVRAECSTKNKAVWSVLKLGGWKEKHLTPSGILVRAECTTKNQGVWSVLDSE